MNPISRVSKKIKRFGLFRGAIRFAAGKSLKYVVPKYHSNISHKNPINKNKIVFSSYPSFSDNAKILYDYYLENDPNHEFVWLVEKDFKIPAGEWRNTRFVKAESDYHKGLSLAAIKEISTAGLIYYTHTSPYKNFKPREGQLTINLWHGCGYKDIHVERKTVRTKTDQFDFALVPGKIFIDTKAKFWNCGKDQILTLGYPRYDLLKKPDQKAKSFADAFRANNEKLIVWMPTFRKTINGNFPEEDINYEFDLPLLKEIDELKILNDMAQKSGIIILIKRHPKQLEYSCEKESFSNIKFLDNSSFTAANVQLYSFLRYTDAIISDYSSVSVDYILLDKPIAFSLDDFDQYKKSRGFVFENPLEFMPGHHLFTLDDMRSFLADVSARNDVYSEKRRELMSLMHNPCEDYCGRLLTKVKELIGD